MGDNGKDDDDDNGKILKLKPTRKNGDDKENGKVKKKGKKQDLRDKDDEAEGSRSKDRPTAETFSNYMDAKNRKVLGREKKETELS